LDSVGNIFLTGGGVLNGSGVGLQDVFVAKLSPAGGLLWARTIGTPDSDDGTSVAVDHNGNVYVGGDTLGSYAAPNAGLGDPFLVKYSNSGDILWKRQIGTSADDGPARVGIDAAGNAYIAGYSFGDWGQGVSGPNGYLVKYDADGQLLWEKQVGSDSPNGVRNMAVDSQGNSYIIGDASFDGYLAKYDTSGDLVWQRFFGTSQTDIASSVALDVAGNPYVTGWTKGNLGGPNVDSDDAFLLKYDTLGNVLWAQQVGSFGSDQSRSVAIDGFGSAYIAGSTDGSLGGPNAGLRDMFVVRFVPEPHALCLASIGILCGLLPRRRKGAVHST
jgi:hypothetical protein